MPDNQLQARLTVTHLIMGILFTVITSIGGAYVTLREDGVENRVRMENYERRMRKVELDQERTDSRYLEILQKLTDIQVKLESKKDKEN